MCRKTDTMSVDTKPSQSTSEEDNKFFKNILDLIPPSAYFGADLKRKILHDSDDEDQDGNKRFKKKPKRGHGGDMFQTKTVSQIQEHLDKMEHSGMNNKQNKKTKKQNKQNEVEFRNSITNMELLQQKLHEKLDAMKGNRKSLTQEERKTRRQIKQQEKKLRRKMKNNVKKDFNAKNPNAPTRLGSPPQNSAKPVYDKEGKMVFSKFDFSQTKKKQKSKTGLIGKDYKKLLEKLERKKSEFEKLRQKDEKAAKDMEEKDKWNVAVSKAEGEKVKDDPHLLKNAIKRKEKMKEKNKKKWDDRQKTVTQKKQAKQDKRERNLDKRKQGKKDKKKKLMIKRGRIIPGF
ncbi:surfeit locus protein 6 homolog [Patella vulgata]|uniref:surfeit locus protein 6 homolog n=1 Tax=Patella vulgata TaxID=6465 RepID=UPI00217F9AD1|nr:surfeit locus protein 6 homolog [Patella vulgata]